MRAAALVLCLLAAASAAAKAADADEFFIVSSVDAANGRMVLKRPTEVTLTMTFSDRTKCRDEDGKALKPADLRAGDTVFIVSAKGPSGELWAASIRKGVMTLPELRKRYLSPT